MAVIGSLIFRLLTALTVIQLTVPVLSFLWSTDDDDEETGATKNRHFADCKCLEKVRTTYITTDICGQAALCYWEIWNYKYLKFRAKGENYTDEECDKYLVQKFTCLIGYPKPQYPNENCYIGYAECNQILARLLYDDCEPIRQERGLPKPEDVDWRIKTDGLNYDLKQSGDFLFESRPSDERPTHNGYYTLSCPIIYRYPYFTIDLLLRTMDPDVDYDETNALDGVAEMLPKYVREGINNERILNFDALSLDQSMIHWCGISRNYICIDEELDPNGDVCLEKNMQPKRIQCEGPDAKPPWESSTKIATNPVAVVPPEDVSNVDPSKSDPNIPST